MKKNNIKKLIICMVIILIIIGSFFIGRQSGLMTDTSTTTTTITEVAVSKRKIQNTLSASGEITSGSTEKLELDTSKYFKTMCVENDDSVLEGENILEYTDGTFLVAPYDCVIKSYSVPETENICTTSHYIEVQTTKNLIMTISVNENQISGLSKGQEVTIKSNVDDTKAYKGIVTKIDGVGTYASSGATFSVTISFENDGNLKLGMSASCEVVLKEVTEALSVPISAVQTEDDKKYVIIVTDDGTTKNVEIETGISDDDYVEVKSGLEEGQIVQVITTTTKSTTRNNNKNSKNSNTQGGRTNSGMGGSLSQDKMQGGMGEPPSGSGGSRPSNK